MNTTQYEIRPGAYYDSVVLMQLQKALAGLPGVVDAGVVMATPANCELLTAAGFSLADIAAKADDLLIIIQGESETAAADALAQVDDLLKQRRTATTQGYRPHSIKTAVSALPTAQWVLISVPGRYAAAVADEALDLGKHVFLYSDNVALEDEIKLKQKARAAGLLMLGPDCGTAVLHGVGLGFANRVRRGSIGIVAASGTGLQAASTEIHNLGGGVSQAIGTGGRDLQEAVGGITALQALDWLAQDEKTAVILLISKPPAAQVAANLLRAAQTCSKPVVANFIGYAPPGRRVGNLLFASGLTDAAEHAVQLSLAEAVDLTKKRRPLSGYVRGLFSGGTLAYEMLLGLQAVLTPLYSNLAANPAHRLANLTISQGHTILDLGEDEFTQGRLHPMMDNDLRLRRLRQEAADPEVDLILLDVVLGDGAHPDPAAELAPAVAKARQAGKRLVAIVVGTEDDPQDLNSQIERLAAAGAVVFPNVNEALDYVYNRLPPNDYPYPSVTLGNSGLSAINVGLESFYQSVVAQGGTAVHVDWRPPAGGNEKLMAILAKMKK
ncbi:MAG: acyl-CoA synthetase FdrA [Anaerolineales bacterium]|nr:acyl-CoA synthetase FdrA [Anaerolineales bacterium]